MRCFAHGNCLYQVRHGNTARGLHFKPSVHVVSYYYVKSGPSLATGVCSSAPCLFQRRSKCSGRVKTFGKQDSLRHRPATR